MADHIYELAASTTAHPTAAAAGSLLSVVPATLASGVRPPEIREIGITNVTGIAAEVGIGYPAALGTGTVTSATVQALNSLDPAGHTTLATSYATTNPTAPTNYMRRAELQAVAGAGVIFTWQPGEWMLWAGATINAPVIFQISTLAVTYDIYVKVAE